MSHRLNISERRYILREMLGLARFLTSHNVPPPQIRDAVKRLRDDLIALIRAGSKEITVDKESYLETNTDQQKGEAR